MGTKSTSSESGAPSFSLIRGVPQEAVMEHSMGVLPLTPMEAHGWSPDFLSSVQMTPAEEPGPVSLPLTVRHSSSKYCMQAESMWSISRRFLSFFLSSFVDMLEAV